jgi:hypothetical protein
MINVHKENLYYKTRNYYRLTHPSEWIMKFTQRDLGSSRRTAPNKTKEKKIDIYELSRNLAQQKRI